MTDRRTFVTLSGAALLAMSATLHAEAPRRVGFLSVFPRADLESFCSAAAKPGKAWVEQ